MPWHCELERPSVITFIVVEIKGKMENETPATSPLSSGRPDVRGKWSSLGLWEQYGNEINFYSYC